MAGSNYVAYNLAQARSDSEKLQARNNIGAAAASDVETLRNDVDALSNVSVYSTKGEATVAELNARPAGIQAGWSYILTDAGTLTDGSLVVKVGDTVAWDGSKWFMLVDTQYFASKSSLDSIEKIKVDIKAGVNLFDRSKIETGKYLLSSGNKGTNASYCISDYIPVEENETYCGTGIRGGNVAAFSDNTNTCIIFYDATFSLISYASATTQTYTTPLGAKYVRFSLLVSTTDVMFEKGSSRSAYEAFTPIGGYLNDVVKKSEFSALSQRVVDKSISGNLLDVNSPNVVPNKYLTSTGSLGGLSGMNVSDYMAVKANTTYMVCGHRSGGIFPASSNANVKHCFYDSSKTFLSSAAATTSTVTTPASAAYMRVTFSDSNSDNMVMEGMGREKYYLPYSVISGYLDQFNLSQVNISGKRIMPAIKTLPAICIISDDGTDSDFAYANMLYEKGALCGFAVPATNGNFNSQYHKWRKLVYQGFSMLNHNGNNLSTYATEAAAREVVYKGFFYLNGGGLTCSGFVPPGNDYVDAYRTMLGTVHGYSFGASSNAANARDSDILKLNRRSFEEDSVSLQDIKDWIDGVIADGKFGCMYLHGWRIGNSGYHDMAYHKSVIDYLIAKRDAGLLFFDSPDNVIKYFFEL